MQFQFDIASTAMTPPKQAPATPADAIVETLRQILELQREGFTRVLELQREHLNHVRAVYQESHARWRNLLARWENERPDFAGGCKEAYPLLERAYVQLLSGIVEEIAEAGDEALDSDFAVQEFLDRYGMKVSQLSHVLSIIGPLSEAALQAEAAKQQQQQGGTP